MNWLVRGDRLLANPLQRVDRVDIRGKAVRKSRSFEVGELTRLCEVAPAHRRLVYLFLAYTGARKNEARSLLWDDVDLRAGIVTLRDVNTKSAKARKIPLKPELLAEIRNEWTELIHDGDMRYSKVFPLFPSDDALHGDLRKAGIPRHDPLGNVLHFHALRKTFTTLAAASGVAQVSAQHILGHSDPSLTANAYTDRNALPLHAEVAKLPWIGAHMCSQMFTKSDPFGRFRDILAELTTLAQSVVSEGKETDNASFSMAARHGFEP